MPCHAIVYLNMRAVDAGRAVATVVRNSSAITLSIGSKFAFRNVQINANFSRTTRASTHSVGNAVTCLPSVHCVR